MAWKMPSLVILLAKARKKVVIARKRGARKAQAARAAAAQKRPLDFGSVYNLWKGALLNPEQVFAQQKNSGGFVKAGLMLALAGALFALISAILTHNFVLMLLGFSLFLVAVPITAFIATVIVYVFARILGGTGTLRQQFYLFAVMLSPVLMLIALLDVLYIIPLVGGLIRGAIVFALDIYAVYMLSLSLKTVHGFGNLKAILAWLLPLLIVTILVAIFVAMVVAAIIAAVPAVVHAGFVR